eukprot:15368279-Heterocapsa_arctica.AAC.1
MRNLIAPGGFSTRSTFLAPTLRQARAACMEAFGTIPERESSGFGAWLADCLWTEVCIRAGTTKKTAEYT